LALVLYNHRLNQSALDTYECSVWLVPNKYGSSTEEDELIIIIMCSLALISLLRNRKALF